MKAAAVVAWLISCVAVFGLGWYMGQKSEPPKPLVPSSSPLAQVFSRGKGETEFHLKSEKGTLLFRATTQSAPDRAGSLTVCDEKGKPVLSTAHHPNGATKEVLVMLGGLLKHRYGFYDNGDLEFVSKVVESSEGASKEILQYYDRAGKPTRTETHVGHSGS